MENPPPILFGAIAGGGSGVTGATGARSGILGASASIEGGGAAAALAYASEISAEARGDAPGARRTSVVVSARDGSSGFATGAGAAAGFARTQSMTRRNGS